MPYTAADDHDGRTAFQLRFQSLFDTGRGYAFPCDAAGRVRLDALGERERNSYLFARALVGRDFAVPTIHEQAPAEAEAALC